MTTENTQKRRKKDNSPQGIMEKEVFKYIQDLCKDSERVTRTIIYRKVIELHPHFLGGPGSDRFLQKFNNWFYYSFTRK